MQHRVEGLDALQITHHQIFAAQLSGSHERLELRNRSRYEETARNPGCRYLGPKERRQATSKQCGSACSGRAKKFSTRYLVCLVRAVRVLLIHIVPRFRVLSRDCKVVSYSCARVG